MLLTFRRPILTYEGQGCNKDGVNPAKHGIIHQFNRAPLMLPGEPSLGFRPVRAAMNDKAEYLVSESRVNYAKLQTVEHSLPVLYIGRVVPKDFESVVAPAVESCLGINKRTY